MVKFQPKTYTGQSATEDKYGTVKYANSVEAADTSNDSVALSPANLNAAIDTFVPDATTAVKGKVELATDAEAIAASETDKAIVPSNLAALTATNLAALTASDMQADAASSVAVYLTPANLAALTATNLAALTASDTETKSGGATDVYVTPSNLTAKDAFTKIIFASQPVATQNDGTTASAVDTETNVMTCDNGIIFEYYNIGTQTAELVPRIAATGLDISRVETDNIGTEFTQGILASSKHAYTAQTDGPFFVRATVNAVDVSGVDPLVVGFRKIGAYNSTYTSYSDFASIGIVGENDPAAIQIVTNLNAAGASTTDTTDTVANGVNVILEVIVDADGTVTYQIDDLPPSMTAAFTFDSGDVVVPFISFAHATTSPADVFLIDYQCGLV